jgi:hypothetical protein
MTVVCTKKPWFDLVCPVRFVVVCALSAGVLGIPSMNGATAAIVTVCNGDRDW